MAGPGSTLSGIEWDHGPRRPFALSPIPARIRNTASE